jgi:hypothetical protein
MSPSDSSRLGTRAGGRKAHRHRRPAVRRVEADVDSERGDQWDPEPEATALEVGPHAGSVVGDGDDQQPSIDARAQRDRPGLDTAKRMQDGVADRLADGELDVGLGRSDAAGELAERPAGRADAGRFGGKLQIELGPAG